MNSADFHVLSSQAALLRALLEQADPGDPQVAELTRQLADALRPRPSALAALVAAGDRSSVAPLRRALFSAWRQQSSVAVDLHNWRSLDTQARRAFWIAAWAGMAYSPLWMLETIRRGATARVSRLMFPAPRVIMMRAA